jgi:uncharacterized membrane protein
MKRWLVVSIALTVAAAIASGVVWVNRDAWLPDKVPIHWNASGQADDWATREGLLPYLFLMPGIMVGVILLGLVLPWLSPIRFKIEPFQPTYEFIMGLLVALFAYIHLATLLIYTGVLTDVNRWLVGGSLLAIALLGNVLGKVRRNFYVGIRTPWTLASDIVWTRTHRLGAWLFTLGGVVGFVLVMAGVNAFIALSIFGVAAIVPVFYSLWLYKHLERQGRLDGESPPPVAH